MCFFDTPSIPAATVTEPVQPQEAKMPVQSPTNADGSASDARKRMAQSGGAATSTLLTGPTGVENSALSLGRSTLLGQ